MHGRTRPGAEHSCPGRRLNLPDEEDDLATWALE